MPRNPLCYILLLALTACGQNEKSAEDNVQNSIDGFEHKIENLMEPRVDEATRLFDILRDTTITQEDRTKCISTIENRYQIDLNLEGNNFEQSHELAAMEMKVVQQIKVECEQEVELLGADN